MLIVYAANILGPWLAYGVGLRKLRMRRSDQFSRDRTHRNRVSSKVPVAGVPPATLFQAGPDGKGGCKAMCRILSTTVILAYVCGMSRAAFRTTGTFCLHSYSLLQVSTGPPAAGFTQAVSRNIPPAGPGSKPQKRPPNAAYHPVPCIQEFSGPMRPPYTGTSTQQHLTSCLSEKNAGPQVY
ncbi:hypothetical protein TREES_T100007652 [Tupaia chinensis]|uniref:Uncharacterized protein n=1 Tax=Tupaia chinensis TaxID=246437 RepID=L9KS60_TUPCH|nr:hypothetical protein TREES_T100007652 [Tupaia chinensis]